MEPMSDPSRPSPEPPRGRPAPGRRRAGERLDAARHAAGERATKARERMDTARAVAGEQVGSAARVAGDRVDAARVAAGEIRDRVKPRLRGVVHQWAFVVSLIAGGVLVWAASGAQARLAVGIYALSLSALFGTSALYHRVNWRRPSARRWMRRLDHSMIFMLIAGTITPFAVLVMDGPLATALLIAVWAAAAAGVIVELIWVDAPKWVSVAVYLTVGWIGALGFPSIAVEAGIGAAVLIALGGLMYTSGAVIYARQRPDPKPAVFGYHEIFHVLVVVAAASHFAAIALYAVPAG
jgi:hemolysin III